MRCVESFVRSLKTIKENVLYFYAYTQTEREAKRKGGVGGGCKIGTH